MPRTPAQERRLAQLLQAAGCTSLEEFTERQRFGNFVARRFAEENRNLPAPRNLSTPQERRLDWELRLAGYNNGIADTRTAMSDMTRDYARWQIQATQALRRNRNIGAITHPCFGTVRVSRAADMAPYVLPGERHLFETDIADRQVERYADARERRRVVRWGTGGAHDYWTAKKLGQVEASEDRAVGLLFELCDRHRATQYLSTGLMEAVGNITGHTYLVTRNERTKEIVGGRVAFKWCIHPGEFMPPTDRVIGLKNMIEGEETLFRKTGNRSKCTIGLDRSVPYQLSDL